MKKALTVLVVAVLVWGAQRWTHLDSRGTASSAPTAPSASTAPTTDAQPARQAPARPELEPRAGTQFESEGTVARVLSDDNQGSRHQRFIVRLASGRTVLIAHNIDLAPRIEGLEAGDLIAFSGEFENNDRGGVVHWTHRDPSGRHVAGWIKYRGRVYQ
jgi:Protein of unknown function (DUF3465)